MELSNNTMPVASFTFGYRKSRLIRKLLRIPPRSPVGLRSRSSSGPRSES